MSGITYRVLLVDDEPLFRLALRAILAESGLPLHIVAEASDGQEALHMATTIPELDILIVDMKMPIKSGIEFLRELSLHPAYAERKGSYAVIALSAYQDYALVREAFLLGATDYIVKVDLDEQHVIPALRTAISQQEQRKRPNPGIPGTTFQDKEEGLRHILTRSVPAQIAAQMCQELCIRLPQQNKTLIVIRPEVQQQNFEAGELPDVIRQIIDLVLQSYPMEAEYVRVDRQFVVMLGDSLSRSLLFFRTKLNELLRMLQRRIWQYANVKVSIGVSGPSDSVIWSEMYRQADELASLCFFQGFGHTFYPESKSGKTASSHRDAASLVDMMEKASQKLINDLLVPDCEQWKKSFEQWRNSELPFERESDIRNHFSDFLWKLGIKLHDQQHRWDEIQEGLRHPFAWVENGETLEHLWAGLWNLADRVHTLLHRAAPISNNALQQAKEYILQHYKEGITLTLISEMVGFSESHLSKLFVKDTGEKFIDYLTKVRMNKAVELMQSGMKLYEIAEQVGYMNPEHFSRVFKKAFGLSPVQYRDELKQTQKTSSK